MKTKHIMIVACVVLTACSAFTKTLAKTAIDLVVATCVAAHPEVQNEAMMREVCKYAPELAPAVKELIGARDEGLARAGVHLDAGAP